MLWDAALIDHWLDPSIRPLWMGMHFWDQLSTMRVLPSGGAPGRANAVIERKDALLQHAIWEAVSVVMACSNLSTKTRVRNSNSTITGAMPTRLLGFKAIPWVCRQWCCRDSYTTAIADDTDEIVLQKSPVRLQSG